MCLPVAAGAALAGAAGVGMAAAVPSAVAAASAGATSLATAATAGSALGTFSSLLQWGSLLTSVAGSFLDAKAQKKADAYNARVAENNRIASEAQAADAEARGRVEAEKNRRRVALLIGSQRAGFGASGVAVNKGTPVTVLGDTAKVGELDTQTILNNAEREAYGFRLQARNYSTQRDASGSASKSNSPLLSAAGTLLDKATPLAKKWYADI